MSVVEARLGEPTSKVATASETMLAFGIWKLIFENDHLMRRIRSRNIDEVGVSVSSDRESEALDRKVLAIRRGAAIGDVTKALGPPKHVEEIFEGVAYPEVLLSYGAWELMFRSGELKKRTRS